MKAALKQWWRRLRALTSETAFAGDQGLAESEMLFRTLSEKALAGVYIIQDQRFRYVNPAMAHVFGYDPEEIIDKLGPGDLTLPADRSLVQEAVRQRLAGETDAAHYSFRGLRKDGSSVYCEVMGRRVDYDGRPAILGTLLDVSERRRAEEAVRQSEERLRTYFEQANDWIFTLDAEGLLTSVNHKVCAATGFAAEELIGQSPLQLLGPENVEEVQALLQRLLQGEDIEQVELEVPLRSGRRVWLEIRGRTLLEEGEVVGTFHIAREVTERRLAEQALRDRERLYRTLFEHAPIGLGIVDASGKLLAFNDAMLRPSGFTREAILQMSSTRELFCDQEEWSQVNGKLRAAEPVHEYLVHLRRKDGGCYEVLLTLSPIPLRGKVHWQAMVEDISDRVEAEAAEREQRALAQALQDTAKVLNSSLDLDQVLEQVLVNMERVVPYDGVNIMLYDGDTARVVRCHGYYEDHGITDQMMKMRISVKQTVNYRVMADTGRPYVIQDTHEDDDWLEMPETAWVRSYVGAPIAHRGRVLGFLNVDSAEPGFFNKVHATRLQAFADQVAIALRNAQLYQSLEEHNESLEMAVAARTAALRRTSEQVEVILNSSPDAILLLQVDGRVESVNPAFYELFGFLPTGVLGRPLREVIAPQADGALANALEAVMAYGRQQRLEVTVTRSDGSTFDADIALAPVKDNGTVRGGVCSLRDITRLKDVDRMKDDFVSNVSHELRTPITSLRLYHDLLERNPERGKLYLERLGREIDRLNAIIEDLLRLSRLDRGQVKVNLAPVSLDEVVRQYVHDRKLAAAQEGIDLCWQEGGDTPAVNADRDLLEQVLSILITNAVNYTPQGGEVVVTVQAVGRDEGTWVGCAVSDNGPGIPPEEQPKIFDRFFRGEAANMARRPGTGLGLSIASEIVDRHQGEIEVSSSGIAGEGTTFTIWLPAAT